MQVTKPSSDHRNYDTWKEEDQNTHPNIFGSKMVSFILGSSYHTDVCSNVNCPGKFGYVLILATVQTWEWHPSSCWCPIWKERIVLHCFVFLLKLKNSPVTTRKSLFLPSWPSERSLSQRWKGRALRSWRTGTTDYLHRSSTSSSKEAQERKEREKEKERERQRGGGHVKEDMDSSTGDNGKRG